MHTAKEMKNTTDNPKSLCVSFKSMLHCGSYDSTAVKHKAMLSKHSTTNSLKPVILKHFTAEQTCAQICDSKQVLLQHCTAGEERIERESKVIKHDTCSPSSISSSALR